MSKLIRWNKIIIATSLVINLSGCDTWNNIFGNNPDNPDSPSAYTELVETTTPEKSRVIRESIHSGDITTAVNTVVDPPASGDDCVERAPAATEKEVINGCPKEEFKNSNILYIGDSHSVIPRENPGNSPRLGNRLMAAIEKCEGAKLTYNAVCGASPRSFTGDSRPSSTCGVSEKFGGNFEYRYSTYTDNQGRTRPHTHDSSNLSTMVEREAPAHAIINLGDNMFNWSKKNGKSEATVKNPEGKIRDIQKMLEGLPTGAQCTWVGPTYHSEGRFYRKPNRVVDEFYLVLRTALGNRCRLIDSRPLFSQTSPNDGLHLVPSESRTWGDHILSEISSN